MKSKNILGLDLGTNSIGWAVVTEQADDTKTYKDIAGAGSRIIPMDAQMQSDFAKGNSVSQTAERTRYRGTRRINERSILRRERLHRVLSVLGILPKHYEDSLDRYGKFKKDTECKLPWATDEAGNAHFLFAESYNEMLRLFWQRHPKIMERGQKIPYDWTIYYIRQKALTQPITPQELAWILLNFNQKRGYYQTRGLDEKSEQEDTEKKEYLCAKIVEEIQGEKKKNGACEYTITLDNGMKFNRTFKQKPNWVGTTRDFIVTTKLDDKGNEKKNKYGETDRSFRTPKEDDWALIKLKTQNDINNSGLTVGKYIFQKLLENPKQKIKGELIRVIERDYYKGELEQIIETQKQFIPELQDLNLYEQCIQELYPQNDAYRKSIKKRDFKYLFVDDIIFYQRPLKRKTSLISDCPYEINTYIDKNGKSVDKPNKAIAKSHPIFQEFRLWQFIQNLRIYEEATDREVTQTLLPDHDAICKLYDDLNDRKSVTQSELLKIIVDRKDKSKYRWNYVQDKNKAYPCNETRGEIINRLKKANIPTTFLNKETEEKLWHILYSISSTAELKKALTKFAKKHIKDDVDGFVKALISFPLDSDHGSYSAKAIKKLLPLMRVGRYWSVEAIDPHTRQRIDKIITGEADDTISNQVREKTVSLRSINDFQGLPLWQACYVVYNRHSEASKTDKWSSPQDIDQYLKEFKQYSLRNPIVEQVVTETLRTVRDIWKQYGTIDEIHLEMGRDLKNPADKRKQISQKITDNENRNQRIRELLVEFMNPKYEIEGVRPYSPTQQEILRIYEETALQSNEGHIPDDIKDILKKFNQSKSEKKPTHSEFERYKLWLEQNYISPYTGQSISLSRLFTQDYEIEHVIPRSLYFDDSLSNKVICEAEVNKLKDNMLGYEFIKKHRGEKVRLSGNREVEILCPDDYRERVESTYKNNKAKRQKLLLEEIPTDFIERQLNDSRYISKFIKGLLSNIVREDGEQESTSKNLIVCSGAITDRLKQEWGVNNVWNKIILPRFERMNEITGSHDFTTTNAEGHTIPCVPIELQKGFNKKRIDHRHHAMDAIVIACTTRDHVNLLNNESALPENKDMRHQLSHKLRRYEEVAITKDGKTTMRSVPKEFLMPWASFPADMEKALRNIIVSFKQNLRVINKTTNHYLHYVDGKKTIDRQTKGDSWAIRKPLHKETVYGEINLRRIKTVSLKQALTMPKRIVNKELKEKLISLLSLGYKEKQIKKYFIDHQEEWSEVNISKIETYYFTKETNKLFFATRKNLSSLATAEIKKDSTDKEKEATKIIADNIADTAIQKILLSHLRNHNFDFSEAFSPEGIEEMNNNITQLNGGKFHQPIFKVRLYENANKFAVGQTGNKKTKFVEAAQGTNLYFAIYENESFDKDTGEITTERSYRTIPLNEVIEKLGKNNLPIDEKALFILSPNDLVYVPTQEEIISNTIKTPIVTNRIYKMVSVTSSSCYFVPETMATVIQNAKELESLNKSEKTISGEVIKQVCIPIKVDRLGNIIEIHKKK